MTRYLIEAPGQPPAEGDYLDEAAETMTTEEIPGDSITWKEHYLTARNPDYGGTAQRSVFEAWRDKPGSVHGFGTSVETALADLLRREHDAGRAPEGTG